MTLQSLNTPLCVCVFARACQCVILPERHFTPHEAWHLLLEELLRMTTSHFLSSRYHHGCDTGCIKSNLPGSVAVSVIWGREDGFFFNARRQLLAPLGHSTLNKNQGICIIHYSRSGTERRHRCPGLCGRTSMSKKPKVKKTPTTTTCSCFCVNQQLTSQSRACTISCSAGWFSKSFCIALIAQLLCSSILCCVQFCVWWHKQCHSWYPVCEVCLHRPIPLQV